LRPPAADPNTPTSSGRLCFFKAIFAEGYAGHRPDSTSNLINSDEDEANKNKTVFEVPDLLEFQDSWGNPLIYIRHTDYGKSFTYTFMGEDGWEPMDVQAVKNPRTGIYYKFESCQIISAGSDGIFDTEDDVANFVRSYEE